MLPKASGFKYLANAILVPSLFALAAIAPAQSAELVAVGAVEGIDCKSQKVQVLGITFESKDIRSAKGICALRSNGPLTYVSLVAEVDVAGVVHLSKLATVSGGYVPGATPVYLRGEVTSVQPGIGQILISGAVIGAVFNQPAKGTVVEILGSQPNLGGLILPSTLNVVALNGRGTSTVVGPELNSSIGTGINSSIGTGLNSSIGTGLNSSIGTGLNSSVGTGLNSSIGTGINSSIGKGRTSVIGTG